MLGDVRVLAVIAVSLESCSRTWGSCAERGKWDAGSGTLDRMLRTYNRRLRERHVRNRFALSEPCCWSHEMRVGVRLARVGGVVVIDRGYPNSTYQVCYRAPKSVYGALIKYVRTFNVYEVSGHHTHRMETDQ